MNTGKFTIGLLLSILMSIVACLTVNHYAVETDYKDIIYYGLVLFTFIAFIVFMLSKRAAKVQDKNFYIYVILINLFVKIIASFIILVLYASFTNPPNKLYLINFTIIYLVFTIFETYFLSSQAKAK